MLNPTSRPSTKQVQTHITTNVPEDESDGSYFSESQHEGAIIGKRKRKAPRAIKGAPAAKRAKGKLSALLTMMPNEVMAEICTHLQPVDLLNLVQSAKIFALFLLTQGSAPIWRSARFQLDSEPPDSPIDLKEQKYACLIFGNYCQRCGVRGCKATHLSLLWGVRRRWCTRCQRSVGLNLGGRSEYIEVMKPRHHVFDELVRAASLHGSRPIHIAKRSDHEAVLLELYQFSGDSDALKAYEASLKAVVKQDHINNSMLLQWIEGRAQERSHNLSETRTQRIGDVRAHLERSGFSRIRINAIPDDEFRVLPEMKHAKRVTEKAWEKYQLVIIPEIEKLIATMQIFQRLGVRRTFCELIRRECLSRTPTLDYLPPLPVNEGYYDDPPEPGCFRNDIEIALLELAVTDQACVLFPWERKPNTDFKFSPNVLEYIPQYVDHCSKVVQQTFVDILRSTTPTATIVPGADRPSAVPFGVSSLRLAKSLFMKTINGQCSSRLHGMSYWQAQHSCPLLCYEGAASRPSFEEESWEFDPVASVLVQKIMQLCGLDPETCTRSDLEAQEPFVICLLCANLNMTMDWEVSWVHWRTMHEDRDAHESSWRLLKSEEASKFRRIWQGDGASSSGRSAHIRSRNKTRYECLLCINPALTPKSSSQRVPMDEPELRHHIASVHANRIENGDTWNPKYRATFHDPYRTALSWNPIAA